MASIPDFTQSELWVIEQTLEERYRRKVSPELAESELRLDPHSTELTPCPAVYWQDGKANFLIFKLGDRRYKGQFFYRVHQQYGTGFESFDDISECTVTLLQVQADFAAKQQQEEEEQANKS